METAERSQPLVVRTDTVASYVEALIEQVGGTRHGSMQERRIALPGLSIRLFSQDEMLTRAAETSFIQTSRSDLPEAGLTVFIGYPEGTFPEPASWSPHDRYQPHKVAQALSQKRLHASYFYDLDHWHAYDPKSQIAVQLLKAPGAFPPWEAGAPLRPFLHWHYAERGMRLAHAGTLGLDGRGILLAGAGGSGKSGTVIAGLLNGLESMGDDYVLLSPGDVIRAYPLFSTLKQDPEGIQRLKLDAARNCGRLNWQGKHQFTIRDLTTAPQPDYLDIGALVVPRVTGGDHTHFSPLARKEAIVEFAASSIYQMPGERESGFRFFSDVVNRLPCFRMDLGRHPREIADQIATFIQKAGT